MTAVGPKHAQGASHDAGTSTPTVTPPRPAQSKMILNDSQTHKYINHNLTVDKDVVNELLLVCGVIGSRVDPATKQIVPVTDCLNWLQDLQRALRRDEDAYRPISLLLGKWKVVQQKLLPLVMSCRYDTALVLTIVKILVILTKPLSESAKKAGKLVIDTKSGKFDNHVIQEQIKLRDNAVAQADILSEYKHIFVNHSSHYQKSNGKHGSDQAKVSKSDEEEEKGLLSIFVSLLAEPLSRTGTARTDQDHLTIELILHLFRNLLSAGEPLLKGGNSAAAEKNHVNVVLHQKLIGLLEKELVFDILIVIGQEMESRENKQYNLLFMEILHHLLKKQDPTLVARSTKGCDSTTPTNHNSTFYRNDQSSRFRNTNSIRTKPESSSQIGSLRDQLRKERQHLHAATSSRHSNFGGTLVVKKTDGNNRFLSASTTPAIVSNCNKSLSISPTYVEAKRKSKKHQHLIGSGRTLAIYTRHGATSSSAAYNSGPASRRAQHVLNRFCIEFVENCYGPVMKSLKNEFRRDSGRLEEEDKVIFFRIIWFFCQWWRVSGRGGESSEKSKTAVSNLIFTMDVFTFNLVLSATDFYHEHKKYVELAQSVSLYTEMMHLLHAMYQSRNDSTEHVMALGLMDRMFYNAEPIDRLPKLLSRWIPATFSREYLCDLMVLVHVTLKLLETNDRNCQDIHEGEIKKKKQRKRKDERISENEQQDTVSRMKALAAEFDITAYVARKIVSNQVVFMFTRLLSHYNVNAVHINHHIVSFFVRLSKFIVAKGDYNDQHDYMTEGVRNESIVKAVTLEPMLYNIHLLMVLHLILNDVTLRGRKDNETLLSFASTLVRHYARASEENPLLHVEALLRHPVPHRFCEMSTNMYVSEELKMMLERESLLEDQHELNPETDGEEESDTNEDNKNEEELEFVDEDETSVLRGFEKLRNDGKSTKLSVTPYSSSKHDIDEDVIDNRNREGGNGDPKIGTEESNFKLSNDSNADVHSYNETGNKVNKVNSTIGTEDNDDKWNSRRKFVPKRKFPSSEKDHVSLRTENVHGTIDDENEKKNTTLNRKRLRRRTVDDNDSEEELWITKDSGEVLGESQPTRVNFYDEDE